MGNLDYSRFLNTLTDRFLYWISGFRLSNPQQVNVGASTKAMGNDTILQSSELLYLEYNGARQVTAFGSAVQKIVQSPRSIPII